MASILVVDDEPAARTTMALLLRKRGHRVREAAGVAAALGVLEEDAFDVVVTDLRMPDGAGLDVLRATKAHRPATEVILLTAYAGWESAKEAMRLGANDYFEKAEEPERLLERIGAVAADRQGGQEVAPGLRHAGLLASPEAARGERAVVTVLFADMRGSLELLAGRNLDEARAVVDAVLERLMRAVHAHGGTVNQVMGDGIMALFGAPIVHTDHAVRACTAALSMQTAVRQYADELRQARGLDVAIRVGLSTGEAVLRSIGSDLRRDYTAVGLVTHLAARMEQLATPGTILITADTANLAVPAVAAQSRGLVTVRGLARPLEVFELEESHDEGQASSDSSSILTEPAHS
jgi:class 3 adenylate cyclase